MKRYINIKEKKWIERVREIEKERDRDKESVRERKR